MRFTDYDSRLGAYGVLVKEAPSGAEVLLARWHEVDPPRWTLPGGGVELGERPADAVVRELAEETGYETRISAVLGVETRVIPAAERLVDAGRDLQWIGALYALDVVGGALRDEVGGTSDQARWWPLSALPEHRTYAVELALEVWRDAGAPRARIAEGVS